MLRQSGGSGGGSSTHTSVDWSAGYWLWPLPDAGVLRLFCEWPVAELELASAEIDAAPIREAAGAVTRLWPAEGPGAWTRGVGSRQSVSTMSFTGTGMVADGEAEESLRHRLTRAARGSPPGTRAHARAARRSAQARLT